MNRRLSPFIECLPPPPQCAREIARLMCLQGNTKAPSLDLAPNFLLYRGSLFATEYIFKLIRNNPSRIVWGVVYMKFLWISCGVFFFVISKKKLPINFCVILWGISTHLGRLKNLEELIQYDLTNLVFIAQPQVLKKLFFL